MGEARQDLGSAAIGCGGTAILAVLVFFAVTFLNSKLSCERRAPIPDARPRAELGSLGSVDINPDQLMLVGLTEDATSRARRLQIANDTTGILQMIAAGVAFPLQRGDRVRIISVGRRYHEVRVESGEHVGRAGYLEPALIDLDE